MDQLALFFSNDLCSRDTVHSEKSENVGRYNHRGALSVSEPRHEASLVKNDSLPCMAKTKISSLLFQSYNLPGTSNLPLDLPPELEEGNIEYKVCFIFFYLHLKISLS